MLYFFALSMLAVLFSFLVDEEDGFLSNFLKRYSLTVTEFYVILGNPLASMARVAASGAKYAVGSGAAALGYDQLMKQHYIPKFKIQEKILTHRIEAADKDLEACKNKGGSPDEIKEAQSHLKEQEENLANLNTPFQELNQDGMKIINSALGIFNNSI